MITSSFPQKMSYTPSRRGEFGVKDPPPSLPRLPKNLFGGQAPGEGRFI